MRSNAVTASAVALAITIVGTACAPALPAPSATPPATRTARLVTPTITSTSTRAPTSTRRSTATPVPTRTATPAPTSIALSDTRLTDLEAQGYERAALVGFGVNAGEGELAFGGPDTEHTVPQLTTGSLAYLQYTQPETQNCLLVFAQDNGSGYAVIALIDASQMNPRLHGLLSPTSEYGPPTLFCSPQGWGDANQNGLPDIAVTFLWANQYTGSEAHLFEVQADNTVRDLFADLPGIVSPWNYDPADPVLTVFDLQWADHDCIYPPMAVVWLYGWRDGQYLDITAELDLSSYLQRLQAEIEQYFGQPFSPYLTIEPLTQLLVMHDRIGQRAEGWQLYASLTDLKNWPGTDAASAAWLQSDVAHFTREVQVGDPYTANDYCDGP